MRLFYRTFDDEGIERIKLKAKPSAVLLNDNPLTEVKIGTGYSWETVEKGGGLLTVRRKNGNKVIIVE